MRSLYRLVTPLVTLLLALLAAWEGHYIVALSVAVLFGLLCFRLKGKSGPEQNPITPLPEIIALGPLHTVIDNIRYPDWLQSEDGYYYSYLEADDSGNNIDRAEGDRLIYQGMVYRSSGPHQPAADINGSFS